MRKLRDVIAERNRDDPRDLSSRSDARRDRKRSEEHLADLARALADLSPRRAAKFDLPQELADAVDAARKISSPSARDRQLRIVRRRLRDMDTAPLEKALSDDATAGIRRKRDLGDRASALTDQLLAGGANALEDLLASHANADRQRLRQLVRNVTSEDKKTRERARVALQEALIPLVTPPDPVTD